MSLLKVEYDNVGASTETLTPLIPEMTDDTAPSGRAFCSVSSPPAGYKAYKAFSRNSTEDNRWSTYLVNMTSITSSNPAYIGYEFTTATNAKKLSMQLGAGMTSTTFVLEGADAYNSSTWTQISQPITITKLYVEMPIDATYKAYRVKITAQTGSYTYGGQICNIQLYS